MNLLKLISENEQYSIESYKVGRKFAVRAGTGLSDDILYVLEEPLDGRYYILESQFASENIYPDEQIIPMLLCTKADEYVCEETVTDYNTADKLYDAVLQSDLFVHSNQQVREIVRKLVITIDRKNPADAIMQLPTVYTFCGCKIYFDASQSIESIVARCQRELVQYCTAEAAVGCFSDSIVKELFYAHYDIVSATRMRLYIVQNSNEQVLAETNMRIPLKDYWDSEFSVKLYNRIIRNLTRLAKARLSRL